MTEEIRRFEAAALPHLNAAYNLARWLVRDEHIAQDMVQEAYLRALKYYDSLRGSDMRPWLLGIVRNTCYTWLQRNKRDEEAVEFDEERDSGDFHALDSWVSALLAWRRPKCSWVQLYMHFGYA